MQNIAIQLRDLKFTYSGSSRPTLAISDLQVRKGEMVFIYGPSGAGKTTLLELLSGVLVPEEGEIGLVGVKISGLKPAERDRFRAEKMGFVFQNFNLLPYLNVRENIELPLKLRGLSQEQLIRFNEALGHLASRLGIMEILEKPVTQISVGQQQRVAVARALLGRPQILLADEPTSSLDYDNREKFLKLLFELSKELGTTVLFVSHDRTLEPLFDRAISLGQLNRVDGGASR
jgi:putative ABC transport system ATP-binding protein